MKTKTILRVLIAMGFIVIGFRISIFADNASSTAATIDMLTSGDWRFSGLNWSNTRTFYSNGTMLEHGHNPNVPVPWKISGNKVIIEFGDYEDMLLLPLDPRGTKGVDRYGTEFTATRTGMQNDQGGGQPAAATAFGSANQNAGGATSPGADSPPAAAVSPELQQRASDLVKTYHDSLLMVTGKTGNGSGFIASMSGTNYLVTNAHVIVMAGSPGFKNLDDVAVPAGISSVAVGADLFRLETKGGKPFDVMENVDQNAAIGDDVVVLGNAEGQGVVNTIMGKIVGIGPNVVEIDAPIVHGNSGSPIVHLKSGKVIGVASCLSLNKYDSATNEKLKETEVRRFGYRLDSVAKWQPVNWQAFYGQADAVEKLHGLSIDLYNFYVDLWRNGHATAGKSTNPMLKDHIDDWIKDRQQLNAEDAQRSDEMFVSFIKNASQTDISALQPYITYDYFQRVMVAERQYRAGISADIEKLILHKQ